MAISQKIFEAFTSTIKINDTLKSLSRDVEALSLETRALDRRLIRLETFVEIAEKQRFLSLSTVES